MADCENDLISIDGVMEQLNIGKNTVYALLNGRQIKAFRIGRMWKIPQASVDEFIRKNAEEKGRLNLHD